MDRSNCSVGQHGGLALTYAGGAEAVLSLKPHLPEFLGKEEAGLFRTCPGGAMETVLSTWL